MFKRKDIIIVIAVLVIAGIGVCISNIISSDTGDTVSIYVDGNVANKYSIYENRSIDIENQYGYNKIVIADGEVYMETADCPDKYCVKHKHITKVNESIVCLPHKLVVEIDKLDVGSYDGIDSVSE